MRILILNECWPTRRTSCVKPKHITSNPFQAEVRALDAAATKWTESSIVVPRTRIMKEPSIAVCGVLGTVVSMHPDLIIADDLISNNNSQTPLQRAKVSNWFRTVVLPMLEPSGQLAVIGTRYHYGDLYSEILADPGFAKWRKIIQKSEWLDESGQRHILFPERFTPEKLDELRATMGTVAYNCQMLNDPSGLEGSDFKAAWLDQGRYDQLPDRPTVFSGVDLAIGRSEGNSRFAIVTIALDRDGTVYVVNCYRDRIPFAEQLKAVKRILSSTSPRLIAIGANSYQTVFIETLRTDPETRLLPLRPINTQGDKHARLRGWPPCSRAALSACPARGRGLGRSSLKRSFSNFHAPPLMTCWTRVIALQGVEAQRSSRASFLQTTCPMRSRAVEANHAQLLSLRGANKSSTLFYVTTAGSGWGGTTDMRFEMPRRTRLGIGWMLWPISSPRGSSPWLNRAVGADSFVGEAVRKSLIPSGNEGNS